MSEAADGDVVATTSVSCSLTSSVRSHPLWPLVLVLGDIAQRLETDATNTVPDHVLLEAKAAKPECKH